MPQYQGLADDLATMRQGVKPTTPRSAGHAVNPIEIDPFHLYAGYPTQSAPPRMVVQHRKAITADGLKALDAVNGRALYKRRLLSDVKTLQVADAVAKAGQIDATQIAEMFGLSHAATIGTLLFLAKYDLITICGLEQNNV